MSLRENVGECFRVAVSFQDALARIARGREDCGRPLSGEAARQIARQVLIDNNRDWSDRTNRAGGME